VSHAPPELLSAKPFSHSPHRPNPYLTALFGSGPRVFLTFEPTLLKPASRCHRVGTVAAKAYALLMV
jgi:hypothetical protein